MSNTILIPGPASFDIIEEIDEFKKPPWISALLRYGNNCIEFNGI